MMSTRREIGIVAATLALVWVGCGGDDGHGDAGPSDIWDIDQDGIPRFVETHHMPIASLARLSKFRSSIGHDYSDAFEHCRSLKHYFEPKSDVDWAAITVMAPVSGTVTRVEQEWAGGKVEIESDAYPAFRFSIFHVNLTAPLQINQHVDEGTVLGTHIGSQTMSDVAVLVNDPTRLGRMVSFFETLTDAAFDDYAPRGLTDRQDVIISRADRDANPLTCEGETFTGSDTLEPWFALQ